MMNPQRGYSLLEMIVAVGVFSLVMLAATGAYVTLIKLDRQARATNDVMTNLSFAVDSMSRSIRTGTAYRCNKTGTNCASTPGTSFRFTDADGQTIDYDLVNGQIIETVAGVAAAITDPRVVVNALQFYVRGVGSGDGIQPQVTFTIRGTVSTGSGQTTSAVLQSSATQRLIDLP